MATAGTVKPSLIFPCIWVSQLLLLYGGNRKVNKALTIQHHLESIPETMRSVL